MSTTLTYRMVTVRKDRQCFGCLQSFPAGTQMRYWSGIYEGGFNSGYTCQTCEEITGLCKDDYDDGYPEGDVAEMLQPGETTQQLLERLKSEKQTEKEFISQLKARDTRLP